MMEQRRLKPSDQDYATLWAINPMAAEQLKGIILRRLLEEAEAQLVAVNGTKEPAEVPQEA